MNVARDDGAQFLGFDQRTGEYEVAYRQVGITLDVSVGFSGVDWSLEKGCQ